MVRRTMHALAVLAVIILASAATAYASKPTGNSGLRVTLTVSVDASGATYSLSGWQSGDFLFQNCVDGNLQSFHTVPAADSIGPLDVFNRCSAYVYHQVDNPDGTFTRTTVSNTVHFHAV